MPLSLDPGPLLKVELVSAARRWQTFALRVGLIAALLAALSMVALADVARSTSTVSINQYAALGQKFTATVLTTQLVIILLAAPAATAGAICIDKSRGNLTLLMMTTLNNAEIVLGKLAGRMVGVLALIAASVPVLFAGSLFGGISGQYLVGGFMVILGAAFLTASVAFLFSVWVGRTHEALLLSYFFIFAWLLAYPICLIAFGRGSPVSSWLWLQNPIALLFAPLHPTQTLSWADYAWYAATTLGTSVLLVTIAVARLRAVVLRENSRGLRRRSRSWRLFRPTRKQMLDAQPLRWYERHRQRPSRAGKIVNSLFVAAALLSTAWASFDLFSLAGMGQLIPFVIMLQYGIGLLMVTVYSVTSLADERSRGNLDILLTTPLTTRAIVWAKWRSAFGRTPWLVVLPVTMAIVQSFQGSTRFTFGRCQSPVYIPFLIALLAIMPITVGAFLASMSLYLVTRLRQFGRAVGVAVAVYILLAVAWPMITVITSPKNDTAVIWVVGSPAMGPGFLSAIIAFDHHDRLSIVIAVTIWSAIYAVTARIFYLLTLRHFNHCLGRMTSQRKPKRPHRSKRTRGLSFEGFEPRGLP